MMARSRHRQRRRVARLVRAVERRARQHAHVAPTYVRGAASYRIEIALGEDGAKIMQIVIALDAIGFHLVGKAADVAGAERVL